MARRCYQCMKLCRFLFHDSRCMDCTRLTPEEVEGEVQQDEDEEL